MQARIFQRPKNAMQSGKALTHQWVLDFVPAEAKKPDPLMGWAGSGDTRQQLQLRFPSKEAAVAYADKHGDAQLGAVVQNSLGNLFSARGLSKRALTSYASSATLADQAGLRSALVRVEDGRGGAANQGLAIEVQAPATTAMVIDSSMVMRSLNRSSTAAVRIGPPEKSRHV